MPRIRVKDLAVELTLDAGTIVVLDGPVSNEIQDMLTDGRLELLDAPVEESESPSTIP